MLHFHPPKTIKNSSAHYLSKNNLARKLYPGLAQLLWKPVTEITRWMPPRVKVGMSPAEFKDGGLFTLRPACTPLFSLH
jgi:hypothetical protein